MCHRPGTPAEQTIEVPLSAVPAHLAHGDHFGPCKPPKAEAPAPAPAVEPVTPENEAPTPESIPEPEIAPTPTPEPETII